MVNEKILNTRIITKHADLTTWESSTLPLKEGEIVLAKVLVKQPDGTEAPTFVAKIGNNATFANSPWLFAKASDVYSWAKKSSLDVADIPVLKLDDAAVANIKAAIDAKVATTDFETYKSATATTLAGLRTDIDKVNTDLSGYATDTELKAVEDKADANATAIAAINNETTGILKTAKDYADGVVGTEKSRAEGVEAGLASRLQIAEGEITKLTGADTVEGSVAKALKDANTYTDTEVAKATAAAGTAQAAADKAQDEVDELEKTVGTLDTRLTGADATNLQTAKDYADDQDEALHATISAEIDADVKTAKDALTTEIAKKVDATAYATDKTALQNADTALSGRIDTLEDKVENVSNVMDFVGAVEAVPADGAAGYQKGDVVVVTTGDNAGREYVYDGAKWHEFGYADGNTAAIEGLQGRVGTLENKVDVEKVSTAINAAIASETSARESADTELQGNIDTLSGTVSANKTAFDDYKTSNDAAVEAVEGRVGSLETRMGTAESDIDALQAASATHALKTDVEAAIKAEADRAKEAEQVNADAIAVLNGTETEAGSVAKAVADAKAALQADIDKKVATETYNTKISALEGEDANLSGRITTLENAAEDYAQASDLTNLTGRVDTAEDNIDDLQSRMGTAEADIDAIQANYVKIDSDNNLVDQAGLVIIFDCGGAE